MSAYAVQANFWDSTTYTLHDNVSHTKISSRYRRVNIHGMLYNIHWMLVSWCFMRLNLENTYQLNGTQHISTSSPAVWSEPGAKKRIYWPFWMLEMLSHHIYAIPQCLHVPKHVSAVRIILYFLRVWTIRVCKLSLFIGKVKRGVYKLIGCMNY